MSLNLSVNCLLMSTVKHLFLIFMTRSLLTLLISLACSKCCNKTYKLSLRYIQEAKWQRKHWRRIFEQPVILYFPLTCFIPLVSVDVSQKTHPRHCHAGPCQWSTEGESRSFSSSLINTLLIGCWEDSSDDWSLWQALLLSDFVEPHWNQSECAQIALFLMTITEGSSTSADICSAKHHQ